MPILRASHQDCGTTKYSCPVISVNLAWQWSHPEMGSHRTPMFLKVDKKKKKKKKKKPV